MNDIYFFTVPVFIKMLGGLKNVLEKSKAHLAEAGKNETEFLNDRLAPDMFPFVKQVQVATDNAKGVAARLASMEIPAYEDTEASIDELIARIEKTLAFLASVKEDSFRNAADVQVTLPYFPGKFMKGVNYAREYGIPNFFFHVAMAYAIARKNGVQIGKADYINGLPLEDF